MNKAIRLFNLQFYQTFIGKKGNCTMLRKQKAACVRLKKVYNRMVIVNNCVGVTLEYY